MTRTVPTSDARLRVAYVTMAFPAAPETFATNDVLALPYGPRSATQPGSWRNGTFSTCPSRTTACARHSPELAPSSLVLGAPSSWPVGSHATRGGGRPSCCGV